MINDQLKYLSNNSLALPLVKISTTGRQIEYSIKSEIGKMVVIIGSV